jgi:gas vesicle protein
VVEAPVSPVKECQSTAGTHVELYADATASKVQKTETIEAKASVSPAGSTKLQDRYEKLLQDIKQLYWASVGLAIALSVCVVGLPLVYLLRVFDAAQLKASQAKSAAGRLAWTTTIRIAVLIHYFVWVPLDYVVLKVSGSPLPRTLEELSARRDQLLRYASDKRNALRGKADQLVEVAAQKRDKLLQTAANKREELAHLAVERTEQLLSTAAKKRHEVMSAVQNRQHSLEDFAHTSTDAATIAVRMRVREVFHLAWAIASSVVLLAFSLIRAPVNALSAQLLRTSSSVAGSPVVPTVNIRVSAKAD